MSKAMLAVLIVCGAAGCRGRGAKSEMVKLTESDPVPEFVADDRGTAWVAQQQCGRALQMMDWNGNVRTGPCGDVAHIALDHDAVFWSENGQLWRARRNASDRQKLADVDGPWVVVTSNGYVYWATPTTVGRVPVAGGPTEVIAAPPVADATFSNIAVDGTRIVAAVVRPSGKSSTTELWRLDGQPRRIGTFDGLVDHLIIDGPDLFWDHFVGPGEESIAVGEVRSQPVDGGPPGPTANGFLLAVRDRVLYVARFDARATYEVKLGGTERRIGPCVQRGGLVGPRLYGTFFGPDTRDVIGYIDIGAH